MLRLLTCFLFALSLALAQDTVAGRASVIDADSLEIQGSRIRLWGVDAVESSQTCLDARGRVWPCGRRATFALSDFLGQRTVYCVRKGTDRYRRMLAVCSVGGVEINRWLVEQGWALSYTRYEGAVYLDSQKRAKAARRGIWQGSFQEPWTYRANPANPPSAGAPRPSKPSSDIYYRNCAEARAAGAAPIYRGQPGYRPGLDRNGDGVACER
ncbi:excalibur calcium-binding domain-containing protein [Meiothermus ruber]|jgi:endonuclease YncB( thermonuclease family)|uniref:Excalibur domain protein n=1 Tax=Meiothermus ruber (strain ATCC 35948 / DSM 1279 / VKM B-1258 / 21) TaxID=504728 RepID=D3PNH3_MEIRD|nr:excalibur calcium-binding domain-containing protein [Meiothermus ruber]ADD27364.1 Excalibur domain protein [Meiothermus ruber DSM 1279]AGK03825.1 excalibur domain-containing protein [Meiothermus ruber DSM 1279]